jgi:hypothetical protein
VTGAKKEKSFAALFRVALANDDSDSMTSMRLIKYSVHKGGMFFFYNKMYFNTEFNLKNATLSESGGHVEVRQPGVAALVQQNIVRLHISK